ncbi:hypothetical protein BZG01_20855 [Labilibaculum manganireducens]|uniref:Uncharacterized protein n=1 Tax=Labilibaculum manganireducens TaxID=1940525 RepID=A0A2N3HR23_9BACT|nr:hypothetical protein BZG01_20855 [Labilibaculum manganireducens]
MTNRTILFGLPLCFAEQHKANRKKGSPFGFFSKSRAFFCAIAHILQVGNFDSLNLGFALLP